MDQNKIKKALGLAKVSNKLIYGHHLFEKLSEKKILFIFIAEDMGTSQKEKLINQCLYYKIPYNANAFNRAELAQACGMKTLVAVGIEDHNIYQLIKKYF